MDALSILMRLGGGHLLEELADALQRVSDDVGLTGEAGGVTLKLGVKMVGRHGDRHVVVEPEIGLAWPKNKLMPVDFFAVDGVLSQDDPRQTKLPFRTVETAEPEIRETETDMPAAREV